MSENLNSNQPNLSVYECLIENTATHLAYLDRDFNFVMVNSAYVEGSGLSETELLGQNHFDLFPSKYNRRIFEKVRNTGQKILFRAKPFRYTKQPWRGTTYWDWSLTPIKDRDTGEVNGLVLSLTDVTEATKSKQGMKEAITKRKRSEKQAKANEERFRAVLENSLDAAYRLELGTKCYDYISPVIEKILGFTPAEMSLLSMTELVGRIHPDDREVFQEKLTEVTEVGHGIIEYRFQGKDGEYHWLADHLNVIKDHYGRVKYYSGTIRDVTEKKRCEDLSRALNEINEVIHATFEFDEITDAVILKAVKAMECDMAAISLRTADYWTVGYSYAFPACQVGARLDDWEEPQAVIAWETKKPVVVTDAFNDYRVNREQMREWNIRSFLVIPLIAQDRAIGVLYFYYSNLMQRFEQSRLDFAVKFGASVSLALANARLFRKNQEELAERRRAEVALLESKADLNRAQAVAHIGSWRLDLCRNVLLWSDETYQIFGIAIGKTMNYELFLATVHPDDREYVDYKWQAALQGETYDIEHRIIVQGGIKWVRERAELEFNSQGTLRGGFGTVQDITESKRLREVLDRLLKETELQRNQLAAIVDNLPIGIWFADETGKILYGNAIGRQIWSGARYVGMEEFHDYKAWWAESGEPLKPDDWAVVRAVKNGETSLNEVLEIECFDGTHKTILNSAVPLKQPDGRILGVVVLNEDLAVRRQVLTCQTSESKPMTISKDRDKDEEQVV